MKNLMFLFSFTLTVSTQVNATSVERYPTSGLECSLNYSSNNVLNAQTEETSAWLTEGAELASTAVKFDGDDDYSQSTPAHYLQISKTKVDNQTFWQVQVLNSEKSVVGVFSFPENEGMKISLPTSAFMNEIEDPTQFDVLNVVCSYIVFAG